MAAPVGASVAAGLALTFKWFLRGTEIYHLEAPTHRFWKLELHELVITAFLKNAS